MSQHVTERSTRRRMVRWLPIRPPAPPPVNLFLQKYNRSTRSPAIVFRGYGSRPQGFLAVGPCNSHKLRTRGCIGSMLTACKSLTTNRGGLEVP